jgi:hypothetical protein
MAKHELNVVFSIGRRCNSTDFMIKFNLRKFSGPFDHVIIDFETSLKTIFTKFESYLCDIIVFNKDQHKIELLYKKNTTEINNKFYELLENNIGYMAINKNNYTETFNQNYLDDCKLNANIYNWNTICNFHHHNLSDNNTYNTVKNRVDRFNNVFQKYNETTSLFFITKIVSHTNIMDYINEMMEIKKKYGIHCFLIVIITCDNRDDTHYYYELDKCLFIVKKVQNYADQYYNYLTENKVDCYDYQNEYNIILKYFNLNLIEKNNL